MPGKGNASWDGNGIQFPIIHTEMDLPSFLSDNHNLVGIVTVGWLNDPLVKPGIKTFVHFCLKLPRNCPAWEVQRLNGASRNSVG